MSWRLDALMAFAAWRAVRPISGIVRISQRGAVGNRMQTAVMGGLSCLVCITLAACAPVERPSLVAPKPVAEVPYRIDYEGWITVQAMVNGEGPYDFIVDSGATITSVFENLTQEQNFAPAPRPPIRILGLTAAQKLPAFKLGDIEIGGQHLPDHTGVILPDWEPSRRPPQGVLGLDFLTRYIVQFDAGEKKLRLYNPADDMAGLVSSWSRAPIKADDFGQSSGMLYRVIVEMQGRPIPCIIDLGASGTLLNYSALRRLLTGVFVNGTRESGFSTGTRLKDIFNNTEIARLVEIRRLRIGGASWGRHKFIVFDAPIFEELGVKHTPFCLVGSDLMLDRSFIFDFEHELLYIAPAES